MSVFADLLIKQLGYIFSISILPVIELRGAIILAAAWDLPIIPAYLAAFLGNILPIPFVLLFAHKILSFLKDLPLFSRFALRYEEKIVAKAESMEALTWLGLVLFVAVPLPGTGAWTGSFIAALLKIPLFKAFLAIALGVAIAGVIMVCASYGLVGFLSFLV